MKTFLLLSVFWFSMINMAVGQNIRLGLPVGHSSEVCMAEYSPDGKYIVTASDDKMAIIWDAYFGKTLRILHGHTDEVTAAHFSPDGQLVITASRDRTAILWEPLTGTLLRKLEGHTGGLLSAEFSPDGRQVVTTSMDGTAKIWDCATGKMIASLEEHAGPVITAHYSLDGKRIVTASEDHSAMVWDAANGQSVAAIHDYMIINDARFSPDGKTVATASYYTYVNTWEVKTGQKIKSIEAHEGGVYGLNFSRDGKYILSAGAKVARLWNSANGSAVCTYSGHADDVKSAVFSPDGKYVLTASFDHTAKLWETLTGKLIQNFSGHYGMVNTACFSPDGHNVLTSSEDGTAAIWETRSGRMLQRLVKKISPVMNAHLSPDGKYTSMACSDGFIKVVKNDDGRPVFCKRGHKYGILYSKFSPDGRFLVTCSADSTVKVWKTGDWSLLTRLQDGDAVGFAEFSPDGSVLATASNGANTWDFMTGEWLHFFDGDDYIIYSAKFSPDGTKLVVAGTDGIASVYEVSSGQELLSLVENPYDIQSGRIDPVYCAEFSPDGSSIITGAHYGPAHLWDSQTGQLISSTQDYWENIRCAHFSPDGSRFITSAGDQTSRVWDTRTGAPVFTLEGKTDGIRDAQFTPDGKNIIGAMDHGNAGSWDAASGKLNGLGSGHSGNITSLDCSRDSRFFVTSSDDGSVICRDAATGALKAQMIVFDSANFLTITADHYYYGSRQVVSNLYWIVDNQKIYPFRQFDLKYNRPDLVLQQMGCTDTTLIRAYRKAYLKRLKRLGYNEDSLSGEIHLPKSEILNLAELPIRTEQSAINLDLKFTDDKFLLDKINLWVNEVPVFGTTGLDIRKEHADSVSRRFPLILSKGENTIQVSCTNSGGVESYRETARITYDPENAAADTCRIFVISAGEYRDAAYNLKYAVKDGRDIARLFAAKNAVVDTLFNEAVTREAILSLREKLMKTGVDDEVILYFSGHGLLDANLDFYFATWDMNFKAPAESGVLYDDLEGLLDGIPARKKLMLMDACHSGEVDKEEVEIIGNSVVLADGQRGDIQLYGTKGIRLDQPRDAAAPRMTGLELVQELFTNLSTGTGTIVISAASGTGFALESPEWNNGVFTYSILNGMKSMAADVNQDGAVSVNELREYVNKSVTTLTHGAQQPTVRKENQSSDWIVW